MFLISASKACRVISRSVCIRARSSSKDRPCLCKNISFSLECGDRLDYVLLYGSDSFVTDIIQRTRRAMVSTSPSQFPYQSNWALSPSSLHTYILRPPCPLDRSFNTRRSTCLMSLLSDHLVVTQGVLVIQPLPCDSSVLVIQACVCVCVYVCVCVCE